VLAPAYQQTYPLTGTGLRDLSPGLLIGAAVNPDLLSNSAYASTLATQFNLIVPENVLKFGLVHPTPDQYNFCPADRLLSFAHANGMQMRGHNFVWHQQVPDWILNGNYSSDQLLQIMHDHIFAVAGHYQGQLVSWDVVNEALNYGPPYVLRSDSIWGNTIGPSYIDSAFQFARAADPNALLYYNDTGGEGLGPKSDAIYNLVADLVARGIPIDGVGLEMHLNLKQPLPPADLAALGLIVSITEMDVETPDPLTPDKMVAQAQIYNNVVSTCLAAAKCVAFGTWGISDAYSWIPSTYPGNSGGLLFDTQFQPKPAYNAVLNLFPAPAPPPASLRKRP
jgi:endo-1,4-beta-xylanase